MTTSPLPWHIELDTAPPYDGAGPTPANIKDQSGRSIGYFFDSRDAELVLRVVNPWKGPMPKYDTEIGEYIHE